MSLPSVPLRGLDANKGVEVVPRDSSRSESDRVKKKEKKKKD